MKLTRGAVVTLGFMFVCASVFADPGVVRSFGRFSVPGGLRERVDFWIDVFTRYGENHAVIHHRNYPQAVFKVLDFTREAKSMSGWRLEKLKKSRIKSQINHIKSSMRYLGSGRPPRNTYEKTLVEQMRMVSGGASKYSKVARENLIRTQTGIKEKYREALKRSGRYMPIMERIFKKHGLPLELTRIPFIESSFDYKAYSSAGAAGLWQFVRKTGRLYMTVNSAVDERRDVVEATEAAAKYLKFCYKVLASWPLAVTSYNHGPYGVKRAVRKAGTRDIVKIVENPPRKLLGFASTNFYPEFLAALEVYNNYDYFFPGLKLEPEIHFDSIRLSSSHSMGFIKKTLNLGEKDLKPLNLALTNSVWKGRLRVPAGYVLKVPVGYGKFAARLKISEPYGSVGGVSSVYGGITYRVRRGDTLTGIAKKFGVSVSRLKALNNLKSNLIKTGQLLRIKQAESPSGKTSKHTKIYTVRRGDNLSKIAGKFNTSVTVLIGLNGLRSSVIKIGQKLRVPAFSGGRSTRPLSGRYKVKSGDSLWTISKKFGVSLTALKKANKIRGSRIHAGQSLVIP